MGVGTVDGRKAERTRSILPLIHSPTLPFVLAGGKTRWASGNSHVNTPRLRVRLATLGEQAVEIALGRALSVCPLVNGGEETARGGASACVRIPTLTWNGLHAIYIASECRSPVAQLVERVAVNPPYGGFESSPGSHSTRRSPVWRGSRHVRQAGRARIQSSRQGGGQGGFGEAPTGIPHDPGSDSRAAPRLTRNGLHAIYIPSECRSPVAQLVERVAVNPPYGGFESSPGSHSTRRSPAQRGSRHVRQAARARLHSCPGRGEDQAGLAKLPREYATIPGRTRVWPPA